MKSHWRAIVILVALLSAGGCTLLTPELLHDLRLFFTLAEDIPAGQTVEAYSTVFPGEVRIQGNFVRVTGKVKPPEESPLPTRVVAQVVLTDLATDAIYFRFTLSMPIRPDGSFTILRRFNRNLRPNTLQTVTVRAIGADIPASSEIALCLEMARRRIDLPEAAECVPATLGGPGEPQVVTVRVLDNLFDPQEVTIDPGDTVRWVLAGNLRNHTTTAEGGAWNSGFIFNVQGATFERLFPASEAGQVFSYFCSTHRDCCQMVGSIQVGSGSSGDGGGTGGGGYPR